MKFSTDILNRDRSRLLSAAKWIAGALTLAWLVVFVALGYPWTMVGSSLDALSYLWMADALSHGVSRPESAFGAQYLFLSRFPPGYPIYLAAFGAGVDADGMLRANLAQMTSVIALILMLWVYALRLTRSALAAWLVLIYTLAQPMMLPWSLELFSEPLYAALLLGICLLPSIERLPRAWLWMAVLIGFACLVRSIGLVLIPALALWLWRTQRSPARALAASLIAALPMAVWSLVKAMRATGTEDSYLTQLRSELANTGNQWLDLVVAQLSSLVSALAPGSLPAPLQMVIGGAVLTLFARGAWRERGRTSFTTLAVVLTLLMLVAWPFPRYLDRLAGPIVPLMLVSIWIWWVPRTSPTSATPVRSGYGAAIVGIGAIIALAGMTGALRLFARPALWATEPALTPYLRNASVFASNSPLLIAKIHHASVLSAGRLVDFVPANQCVSTTFAAWLMLHTQVPVRDTEIPFDWENNPCRFVFVMNLGSPRDGFNGMYPMPLPGGNFTSVFISRESSEAPVMAALIQRRQP